MEFSAERLLYWLTRTRRRWRFRSKPITMVASGDKRTYIGLASDHNKQRGVAGKA